MNHAARALGLARGCAEPAAAPRRLTARARHGQPPLLRAHDAERLGPGSARTGLRLRAGAAELDRRREHRMGRCAATRLAGSSTRGCTAGRTATTSSAASSATSASAWRRCAGARLPRHRDARDVQRRVRRAPGPHALRLLASSIVTSRASPPRCASRTRAHDRSAVTAVRDLRPLDERHTVGREVVGQQRRVLGAEVAEPVEVEVRDGHAALVALADRERRAGDAPAHSERTAGAAHERRLAGAELPGDQHDVAGLAAPPPAAPRAPPVSAGPLVRWTPVGGGGCWRIGRGRYRTRDDDRRVRSPRRRRARDAARPRRRAALVRHRQSRRLGRRDDREQRRRARLDGRLRAPARRLRVARGAHLLLPDPVGRRAGAAGRHRPRRGARPARRGSGAGGDAAQLDAHAVAGHGRLGGRLGPAARADRERGRRRPAVGGRDRPAGRRAVAAAVAAARRAAGRGRLPRGRDQPRRRADRPAHSGRDARGGRPRRHRRLPRHAAVADRDGAVLRRGAATASDVARRRSARGRRRAKHRLRRAAGTESARPHSRRADPDRRPHRRGAAAEPRHHRRQAPLLDRRRQLLQRHRGRGEGADLGRDGRRLLPRAGDLAPPRRRRGHSPRAAAHARDRARVRGARAADLRGRRQTAADAPRSAPSTCWRSTRCCRSASPSRCSR